MAIVIHLIHDTMYKEKGGELAIELPVEQS